MSHSSRSSSFDPREHIFKSYAALRRALAIAGIGLPLILLIGSWILKMPVQDSMSQYYHAGTQFRPTDEDRKVLTAAEKLKDALAKAQRQPDDSEKETLEAAAKVEAKFFSDPGGGDLRDWFVGGLFAVGILLIVYKGFLPDEDVALNLAGMFAMGVALFHMPWGESKEKWDHHRSWIDDWLQPLFHKLPWEQHVPSFHFVCAIMLFVCLGYVCFFCGSATLDLPGDTDGKGRALTEGEKTGLRWAYRGCGFLMVSSVVIGPFVSHVPGIGLQHSKVFIIEAVGVVGFVLYWILKSWEISTTGADRQAAQQKLEVQRSKSMFEGHKVRRRDE